MSDNYGREKLDDLMAAVGRQSDVMLSLIRGIQNERGGWYDLCRLIDDRQAGRYRQRIARILVHPLAEALPVNYDDPSHRQLNSPMFTSVAEGVHASHLPVRGRGLAIVNFDYDPRTIRSTNVADILNLTQARRIRMPDIAETMTFLVAHVHDHPDPMTSLCGEVVERGGRRCVAGLHWHCLSGGLDARLVWYPVDEYVHNSSILFVHCW